MLTDKMERVEIKRGQRELQSDGTADGGGNTECKSWNDRSFNTKNQMIRLITFPFVCALMAWITLVIRGVNV